jgi:membrane carboxypeptidase/penicillin-binding protein PbpC
MPTAISPSPPAAAPELHPGPIAEREETVAPARPPRRRRRLRHGFRTVLVLLIVIAAAFEVNIVTDPSLATAPAIVVAFNSAHGSVPEMIPASDRIAQALVASEDDTFYSNNGVDNLAMARAFWGFLTRQDLGGSTIEMQLAHTLYPAVTDGFWGRVRRVSLALELDTHFTKDAILSMYLSAVYFGHGYYGIRAASAGYFGVAPAQLTWAQAALLAGIVQAPSALDPFRHLAAAEARMSYVLQRLVSDGRLTAAQATQVARAPLDLVQASPPRR